MPTQPVQQDSEEGEPLLREEDEFSVPSMKQTQQTSNTAWLSARDANQIIKSYFNTSFFSYAFFIIFESMRRGQDYHDTNR
jgi:hypothetical protein